MIRGTPFLSHTWFASAAVLALLVAAGCGVDPDRAELVDAGVSDAAPDAAACTKPKVFINRLLPDGEAFTEGTDSAATNTSSLVTGTVQLGPMAEAETALAVAASRAVLEPLGIQVTDVDPGSEPHLELVIVGSGWPFSAGYRSTAPFACGFRPNRIAFIRGIGPGADIAGAVAYSVGIFNGLEPTEVPGNCMTNSAGADCTFAADAPITTPRCNVAVKDQVAILRQNLGCP